MDLDSGLTPVNIEDQMRESYLEYAMSVIIGRALPDARDGLKPVHRRILFAMHDLGNYHDKPFKKSARVAGDVIGKYHPHGESAVYDTMVRMAQDFSLRYPLIQGQGNFGSVDGDPAAAMRYTEVRLSKISSDVLSDLEKETVDYAANYDSTLQEPLVLPTKIPNLLVNGSSGIAVGMATNIPPHNLTEIVDGIAAVISNPEISTQELMKIIPGPDFPTAGFIYGRSGLKEAYNTGKGIIKLRARTEIETTAKERERIVVTEIPFQVNKAKLIETVAQLVRDKKVEGISDLRDESDRKGMRVVFDLKKGEDSRVILNQLFKNTQMETSFGITMLALDNKQPKLMSLKELLKAFLQHRKEIVTRRTAFELRKAEARAHILEALKIAVENLDDVVALIRKAENPQIAQAGLMKKYEFTEIQAKAILDMRLHRLTGLERDKIVNDYEQVLKLINELKAILADENKVLEIVKQELLEIREKFGDERRTDFIETREEVGVEDYIQDEQMFVTVTYSGYIKRLPPTTYRSQRRGGRGVIGAGTKTEDFIQSIFVASTHDYVLCFTDAGKVYWLKVHKIPEGGRTAKGKPIVNLLNLGSHERVLAVLPVKEFTENKFIFMATESGVVKKTSLMAFARPKKTGIIATKIVEGDSLVNARITDGDQNIILVTSKGQSIRFAESDVREMGRTARGVTGMRLSEGDKVIDMTIVDPQVRGAHLLTVTEKGFGKRTSTDEYRIQGRGGSGIRTMKVTDKNGPLMAVRYVVDDDEIIIASDKGKVIRTKVSEISEVGRVAQGVRLINLEAGETVGAVAKIVDEDPTNAKVEAAEAAAENSNGSSEMSDFVGDNGTDENEEE